VARESADWRVRALIGALLAILLALRLLSPDGFMPAFDQGAVTIVACPDFNAGPAPMAHHGGAKFKAQCPYAASAGPATGPVLWALAAALIFAAAAVMGRTNHFLERQRVRLRPPSRAPPLPARA
jgi:hypothetical protein